MKDNSKLLDERMARTIAFAMQGMAFWHLVLGVIALMSTLTVIVAQPHGSADDLWGMSAISGAEVAGAALATALILGGISWAMQGRAFWRPRWSIILVPGLVGTLTTELFEVMDWPVSFLVGGAVAYWLVSRLLEREPSGEDGTA
jgi:hypothetical protein